VKFPARLFRRDRPILPVPKPGEIWSLIVDMEEPNGPWMMPPTRVTILNITDGRVRYNFGEGIFSNEHMPLLEFIAIYELDPNQGR
jgi:hypothetical protein